MDIGQISEAIQRDGVWVVFVNVLLQQLGLPVPAVPTLLLAGSLALTSGQAGQMLLAAVAASVLADWLWYLAGRSFGYRVLNGLCRLSINPGSCVSETESRFLRWGLGSLVLAKFIPGFSTVAPPIAGALRMPLPGFIAAVSAGAMLWAGGALLAGWLLRERVREAIATLNEHGVLVVVALAVAAAVWLGWKLWQKYRFECLAAIPHITPAELIDALASPAPPLLLDLRGATMQTETGPIPGATPISLDELRALVGKEPWDRAIVTLCACPEDASAIKAARELGKLGYTSVRPLRGGYEAWLASARPQEEQEEIQPSGQP